jgi:hypothetical protein
LFVTLSQLLQKASAGRKEIREEDREEDDETDDAREDELERAYCGRVSRLFVCSSMVIPRDEKEGEEMAYSPSATATTWRACPPMRFGM